MLILKRPLPVIRLFFLFLIAASLFRCSDVEVIEPQREPAKDALLQASSAGCGCAYMVPVTSNTVTVDGKALNIKPGAVICLKGGTTYRNIIFKNIRGTALAPITIKNCGGNVIINATGTYFGLKTQLSSHFRISGGSGSVYGIKINGGHHSVTLEYLTSNVELDHVEVAGSGFSGIMAKTDPSCDNATIRANFTMRDVKLHDNFVHDTGGEAFYVGHTYWNKGVSTSCGTRYPHAIEGLKIYNNVIRNSGWEAIQVGSTPSGSQVYYNRIENYGTKNKLYQNHGVQFSEGAPGEFFGNYIKGGKGNALIIMGNAQNFVHDNVIVNAGMDGMFFEDRAIGKGFTIINNTIINPAHNGIRLYSDQVSQNSVYNNIIVNPGNYSRYTYPRSGNDAYVYLLSKTMPYKALNNFFTRDIQTVRFINPTTGDYGLQVNSPAVNKGTSVSLYNIFIDFKKNTRTRGTAVDIGACELQ